MGIGSLFSGIGGADLGLAAASPQATHKFACEIDSGIRLLYQARFSVVKVFEDIAAIARGDIPQISLLWASPPCTNFSLAKRGGKEEASDLELARAIVKVLRASSPEFFFLENVPKYARSRSFSLVLNELCSLGYAVSWRTFSMAAHGFFQDRNRLILRAQKGVAAVPPIYPYELINLPPENYYLEGGDLKASWLPVLKPLCENSSNVTVLTEKQKQSIQVANAYLDRAIRGRPFLIERFGYSNRLPIIRFFDSPCVTIRACHGCDDKGYFRSPLTYVSEDGTPYTVGLSGLAALQGFSQEDFLIYEQVLKNKAVKSGTLGKAIGNAVPPVFVKWIVSKTLGL